MESKIYKPVSNIPKYAVGWFLFLASLLDSQFYEKEWPALMRALLKDSSFEAQLVFNLLNFIPITVGLLGLSLLISATEYNIFK